MRFFPRIVFIVFIAIWIAIGLLVLTNHQGGVEKFVVFSYVVLIIALLFYLRSLGNDKNEK